MKATKPEFGLLSVWFAFVEELIMKPSPIKPGMTNSAANKSLAELTSFLACLLSPSFHSPKATKPFQGLVSAILNSGLAECAGIQS